VNQKLEKVQVDLRRVVPSGPDDEDSVHEVEWTQAMTKSEVDSLVNRIGKHIGNCRARRRDERKKLQAMLDART